MKKLFILLMISGFGQQLIAQKVVLNVPAQKFYDRLLVKHTEIAGVNTEHFLVSEALTGTIIENRLRIKPTGPQVQRMRRRLDEFKDANIDYHSAIINPVSRITFIPVPSVDLRDQAKAAWARRQFRKRLDRRLKYLELVIGVKAKNEKKRLPMSEGDRIVLLLTGLEDIIRSTLESTTN